MTHLQVKTTDEYHYYYYYFSTYGRVTQDTGEKYEIKVEIYGELYLRMCFQQFTKLTKLLFNIIEYAWWCMNFKIVILVTLLMKMLKFRVFFSK